MKYINREYGFLGRPPFYPDYYEENSKGALITKDCYRDKPLAGAGLDVRVPNGVLLTGRLGAIWGCKFSYQKNGRWIDSSDFLDGEHFVAADKLEYRYINCDALSVSMVRYSKTAYVISLTALEKVKIRVTFYAYNSSESVFKANSNIIKGMARERAVLKGNMEFKDDSVRFVDRYEVYLDDEITKKEYFCGQILGDASMVESSGNTVVYEMNLVPNTPKTLVYVEVSLSSSVDKNIKTHAELIAGINKVELDYAKYKTVGSGVLVGDISNILSNIRTHKVYNPLALDTEYLESRSLYNPHYAYDPLYMTEAALLSTLINDVQRNQVVKYAKEPILGALTVYITYMRTRDIRLVEECYDILTKVWSNDNSLVVVDLLTKREIAYRMDKSPIKDIKIAGLYSLDMSCYKLLALDILERLGRVIRDKRAKEYALLRDELKIKINSTLYNDKIGLYCDRYMSGEFSSRYGATSFLPMIAGAVEDIEVLQKMMVNLSNKSKFYTKVMVPTLSKNDVFYGKNIKLDNGGFRLKYEDYTGSALPRLNYLIFLGLERMGVNSFSWELARNSVTALLRYKAKNVVSPSQLSDNYAVLPNTRRNSLSGNFMGIIGLSELLDIEYFRADMKPSIRFGTFCPGEHRLNNVKIFNRRFSLQIGDKFLTLQRDGETVFSAIGGNIVVRNLTEDARHTEFMINCVGSVDIAMSTPFFVEKRVCDVSFNLPSGKFFVEITDGKVVTSRLI